MSTEEYDWIFDYVLQFIESDKFDASVMDFIDEKCQFFDNDEENKFIYSDIHREFREHMEVLISSNLGELGITSDIFFEACDRGRNGRDINRLVFEKLIAMDDFMTFKKMMVKRNMELEVEYMKNYMRMSQLKSNDGASYRGDEDSYNSALKSSEEEIDELNRQELLLEAEVCKCIYHTFFHLIHIDNALVP